MPPLWFGCPKTAPGHRRHSHLRVALPSNADGVSPYLRLRVPDLFTPTPPQAP